MRRVLALAALLILAAPAQAHYAKTSRMHSFRHVAQFVWGDPCDVPTLKIPIVRVDEVPGADAQAWWAGTGFPRTGCIVHIERRITLSDHICRLTVHEIGHFRVGATHSADPTNIMFPTAPPFFLCGQAKHVARSYP
jgi:hypothetical protein